MNKSDSKVFVLDTSVILHDPDVVERLEDNFIVIPIWVIEELDKVKKKHFTARDASRNLEKYLTRGKLKQGVKTDNRGELYIDYDGNNWGQLPDIEHTNDNRVLLVAKKWQEKKFKQVIVLSKDINLRIKANACGLDAQDYQNDKIIKSISELYSGLKIIDLNSSQLLIDPLTELHRNPCLPLSALGGIVLETDLLSNQCCRLVARGDRSVLAIYKAKEKALRLIDRHKRDHEGQIRPINDEQCFAYALLSDPEIQVVTLAGKAGTGKTLLALLAGYEQLEARHGYEKILIWRPTIEVGQPMGFLPGDINEKFEPWTEPIIEALRLILRSRGVVATRKDNKVMDTPNSVIEELMKRKQLEMKPINFAQGSTKHSTFIIIDEAQNLTPTEVKLLITRCGAGSKIILTGDPAQVYNLYLDPISNGLSHAIERLRGQKFFGHVSLVRSERSEVAEIAANLL